MGRTVLKLSRDYNPTPDTNPCYTRIEAHCIHSGAQQPAEARKILDLYLHGGKSRNTEGLYSKIQRIVLENIGSPMSEIQQSIDGLVRNSGIRPNGLYKITERSPKSRYVSADYDGILRKKGRDYVWTYRGMAKVRSLVAEQVSPLEFDENLKFKAHYVFQRRRTQKRERKRIQK